MLPHGCDDHMIGGIPPAKAAVATGRPSTRRPVRSGSQRPFSAWTTGAISSKNAALTEM